MDLGADYVDVELQAANDFISSISGKKPENFKIIVSSHNYQSTPSVEELTDLAAKLHATGADIVKIATTAVDITDVAQVFRVIVNCQVPVIGWVMGERGLISRLLSPKYGGYLTYGALESSKQSAPWEPTLRDLLHLYNIRQVRPDTKVFGVIGKPIGHSKGPTMYNATFKHVGFNGIYVHLLVDDLARFLDTYASPDFPAFSCGIPHKEAAVVCCDEVDPIARSIGAVNTIVSQPFGQKLMGYNTDYYASISAIEDALRDRAKDLAALVGGAALTFAELENFHPEKGMILANATSVGMQPQIEKTPIPKHALRYYAIVFDAVYTPKVTRLLQEAEASGAIPVSGVEMFIRQAKGQFQHFTGLAAPEEVMREAILNKI